VKDVISLLQIVLAFTVIVIVAQNSQIFAMIKGTGVNIALILCLSIIGLKVQMRLAK